MVNKTYYNSVKNTSYGFKWGDASVERCASHNGHLVLSITTSREALSVRITPTGFIRVDSPIIKREKQNAKGQ